MVNFIRSLMLVAALPLFAQLDQKPVPPPAKADGALLTAGVFRYAVKVAMGERTMNMDVTSTLKKEDGVWKATDSTVLPNGTVEESTVLDGSTLLLLSRKIKQGPVTVQFEIKAGKAVGSMEMNGQTRPVQVDLDDVLFADGAGSPQALGALPLTAGYKARFHNLDVMKQKNKPMQVEVTGEETVTVAAGTFSAWKLQVGPVDGSAPAFSFWIDKATRKYVKSTGTLPQGGGASVTAELVP
jgi:hypothetical protein